VSYGSGTQRRSERSGYASRPDNFAPVQVQAFAGMLLRRFLGKTVKSLLQIGVAPLAATMLSRPVLVTNVSKIEQTPFCVASRMPARGVRGLAWTTKNPLMSPECWLEICR